MEYMVKAVAALLILICFSCSRGRNDVKVEKFANGNIKEIIISDKEEKIIIEFYPSTTNIKTLKRVAPKQTEQLYFYNNGFLEAKVSINPAQDRNGPAIYFYPSGFLSGHYEFKNGILINYSMDFWDSTTIQKAIKHYSGEDYKYYKIKEFDEFGNLKSRNTESK